MTTDRDAEWWVYLLIALNCVTLGALHYSQNIWFGRVLVFLGGWNLWIAIKRKWRTRK